MEDAISLHDDIDDEHLSAKLVVCGHTFGEACIVEWLENATTCPMCRTVVYNEPNPAWALRVRQRVISTLKALLHDETICAAMVRRAIDLILNNTVKQEFPRIQAWEWMLWRLSVCIPGLAADGWAAYIEWLEKDVIQEWVPQPGRYWYMSQEERETNIWMVEEAQPMVETIRSEVDCCRELMGWEALPVSGL